MVCEVVSCCFVASHSVLQTQLFSDYRTKLHTELPMESDIPGVQVPVRPDQAYGACILHPIGPRTSYRSPTLQSVSLPRVGPAVALAL